MRGQENKDDVKLGLAMQDRPAQTSRNEAIRGEVTIVARTGKDRGGQMKTKDYLSYNPERFYLYVFNEQPLFSVAYVRTTIRGYCAALRMGPYLLFLLSVSVIQIKLANRYY
jgi:hypothetical protein